MGPGSCDYDRTKFCGELIIPPVNKTWDSLYRFTIRLNFRGTRKRQNNTAGNPAVALKQFCISNNLWYYIRVIKP